MDFLKSLSQFEGMQVCTYCIHRINSRVILRNIKNLVDKKLKEAQDIK